MAEERLAIYTDGASSRDRFGGWAWWHNDTEWENGGESDTTNQRMEMTAALQAMLYFADTPITIYSDSAYVVNCFLDQWYVKWRKNKWRVKRNGKWKDVANRDLWEQLIDAYEEFDVEFVHVRGHAGILGNEKADELAVEAKINVRN